MIRGGKGGDSTKTGIRFEKGIKLKDSFLRVPGFTIHHDKVYRNGVYVGQLCGKNGIYKKILEPRGVEYYKFLSKKLLPDDAVLIGNTLYIVEAKFQTVSGSVDEKLQTCDFKKKQYTRLFETLGIDVQYVYVLNGWFMKPEYMDVLAYVKAVGCHYYFEQIPLSFLGL